MVARLIIKFGHSWHRSPVKEGETSGGDSAGSGDPRRTREFVVLTADRRFGASKPGSMR